jgi:hypothetical protein
LRECRDGKEKREERREKEWNGMLLLLVAVKERSQHVCGRVEGRAYITIVSTDPEVSKYLLRYSRPVNVNEASPQLPKREESPLCTYHSGGGSIAGMSW